MIPQILGPTRGSVVQILHHQIVLLYFFLTTFWIVAVFYIALLVDRIGVRHFNSLNLETWTSCGLKSPSFHIFIFDAIFLRGVLDFGVLEKLHILNNFLVYLVHVDLLIGDRVSG